MEGTFYKLKISKNQLTNAYDAYDWRIKCKNVNEMLAEARKKAMFIDVQFLVGKSLSAKYFTAHKVMLACGSPVFESMFFGQLADKRIPVTLPDDDPEAFEIMLKCLYGETIVFPSILAACKSYSIGDKYLITKLKTKSADFIKASSMNDENFWGVIKGNLLTNKYIEEKLRCYIELNADQLVKCDEFLNAPEYVIKLFLHMEIMNISEVELLTSVAKWCLKNFTKDTMGKTQDFLQYVRFSVLTSKEFCLFTENFPGLLDASTSLEIVKHLIDKSIYNLPIWCSTKKEVRKPIKVVAGSLNAKKVVRKPVKAVVPPLNLKPSKCPVTS